MYNDQLINKSTKKGYDQINNTKCRNTNSIVVRLSVSQSFTTNKEGAATDKINQQWLVNQQFINDKNTIVNSLSKKQ